MDSLRFENLMADWDATDLSGHYWRSGDWAGKITIVDIWATTCPPCRREHPELQRFYDRIKGRKNIALLTFSIDDDPHRVESYMKENKYTFPVIVNADLVQKLFTTAGGIPQTWVVDHEGRKSVPFRSWSLGRILSEAEKFAALKAN